MGTDGQGRAAKSSDGTCPLSSGGLRVPGWQEQLPGAHGSASGRTPATITCQQLPKFACTPGSPVRSPAECLCPKGTVPWEGLGPREVVPPPAWCSRVVLAPEYWEGRDAPRPARPQQVRGRGGPVAGHLLLSPSLDATSKLPCALKLDARLLRLPARSCVRTHPASAYCVQVRGRSGQTATSRACSKDRHRWHRPALLCRLGVGWAWAFSGWFGGTPLAEGLRRGGPKIVEAQSGEGMVSRAVGEGQPSSRPGQPEPPLGLEAGVCRLTQLGVAQGSTTCKSSGPSAGKVGVQAFVTHTSPWGVGPGLLGTQAARPPSLLHARHFSCPGWRLGPWWLLLEQVTGWTRMGARSRPHWCIPRCPGQLEGLWVRFPVHHRAARPAAKGQVPQTGTWPA